MYESSPRARSRVLAVVAVLALCAYGLAAAGAAEANTITVNAGSTRSVVDTDGGYANPVSAVPFEKAGWVSDPTLAVWSPLCTTDVTGSCTSAAVANGRYLVRESQGGPFGWRIIQTLAWGGSSSGASPDRSYVGDVTVNNASVTVHPSTAWSPTAPSSSSGPFIVAKNNPSLPSQCGLNVLLLIDRSGSIAPQAATYKAAAQQFVSTLSGTPTNLKIFSFSEAATADQNTFLDLSNPADVTAANSKLNTIYNNPGGSTNWDAGMQLAAGAGVDVVVFITDGNPTSRESTTSGANSDGGGTVDLLDLTMGMASANKVKTEGKSAVLGTGATILALGVGTGVTAGNLAAVSGPTAGVDYATSAASGLDAVLQQIANKLCGSRIHVRKLTDEGDVSAAKAGWTFTAGKPAGSPLTFVPTSVTTTGLPADDVINVNKVPAAGGSVTLTETAQANYNFASSQCAKNNFPDALGGGTATATIASLQRNEDWYCTFRNVHQTGTIAVVKHLVPASDSGRFDLGVDGGSQAANVGDGGTTGAVSVKTGAGHTATETAHAGTAAGDYDSSYVCTDNGAQISSGTGTSAPAISVASQHAIVCTFTNTRKTGTVKIVKSLVPASDAGRFDLNVDGGTAEVSNVGDAGTTGAVSVNTGSGHSVSEIAHAGSSLADYTSTYACKLGATTLVSGSGASSDAFSVGKGDAVVCTFTNTRKTGTLRVLKVLLPSTDAGRFDLGVDGGSQATNVGDGGDTGAVVVNTGSSHVAAEAAHTGTTLADYASSYVCSDNGTQVASGAGTSLNSISVASGHAVVCTFTNVRKSGSIKVVKVLSPSSDAGRFDLGVDGGSQAVNVGDGGATPAIVVNAGPSHTAAEAAHAGTSLADYVSSYVCKLGATTVAGGDGTSAAGIAVGSGDAIVCTFTNVRKTGTIKVVKNLSPASDAGRFDLGVDGGNQAPNVGDGGTTGAVTVNTGAGHSVAEAAHSGTDASNYSSSYVCTDNGTQSASGTGMSVPAITVASQHAIVCTFTNTRKTGTIKVVKNLVPASDAGRFDLGVDGGSQATNVGNGGTTGVVTVNTGATHAVAEAAHTGTTISDYTSTFSCTDNGNVVISGSGTSVTALNVAFGHDLVCTFTNVRNAGTIKVVKVLSPSSDAGRFDLGVDGGSQAPNVGDGGTTGAVAVNTGLNHSVAEAAHAGTSLTDYLSSYVCKNGAATVASGDGTSASGIAVAKSDAVTCTFTNTRKTGTIKVVKNLVPAADAGRFDLGVDGGSQAPNVGDGGTTGAVVVNTGSAHSVAEAAHSGTSLADYVSSYVCKNGQTTVAGGDGTSLTGISVATGDAVVCTFTNVRKTGTISVVKNLSPSSDAGRFDLGVDGGSQATNVGDGGTTGAVVVNTGTAHSVAEAAHAGTSLADYVSSYVCSNGQDPVASGDGPVAVDIAVGAGDAVVCTFTNVRKTGTIKVVKNLVPASDAGRFDLGVDGGSQAPDVGVGGTTGAVTVNTGSGHSVAEIAHAGTSLADYTSSYFCADGNTVVAVGEGTGVSDIPVASDHQVVCTFTNTRNTGTIEVVKNLIPASDAGHFDLGVDGGSQATNIGDAGTTGAVAVNTGASHSVAEVADAGTSLTDYVSSYSCKLGDQVVADGDGTSASEIPVAKGDAVVCTFTNTRKTGTIEIRKVVAPSIDAGRFDLNVDAGAAEAANVGDGGTTGPVVVNTGAGHSAAETAHEGTSLADYVSTYTCSDGDTTVATGSGTSISELGVSYHESLVCTFTNTRKATVTIHEVTVPHSDTASFGFHTTLPGDPTITLGDGASQVRQVPPGSFAVTQDDPRPAGYKLTGLVCTETGGQDSSVPAAADIASSRAASIVLQPGENVDCTFTDTLVVGSTVVVKAGTEFAYHGDTLTYTFSVTNNGNSPLHDVSVTDDRCPNVSAAPVSKVNDNGNDVLDQIGQDGTRPEEWIFTCSMTAPVHSAGETNPIVNTATVHAADEYDRPVSGQAHHSTVILHPAVTIDKTGPATAVAGDVVTYALVAKNTGDESFAATSVAVTDARCEAPPALVTTSGDTSPATFDPGDTWGYLCNVQTALGDSAVHNTGVIDGTDPHGHHATAQDTADTQLTQPVGSVLPETVTPGTSRLRGQTGCSVSSKAAATVTGRHIASVVFKLDGHKVRTLTKADKQGRYVLRLTIPKLSYGVHHLTARITFARNTGTAAKTLKMVLTRCRPAVIKPKFTG